MHETKFGLAAIAAYYLAFLVFNFDIDIVHVYNILIDNKLPFYNIKSNLKYYLKCNLKFNYPSLLHMLPKYLLCNFYKIIFI